MHVLQPGLYGTLIGLTRIDNCVRCTVLTISRTVWGLWALCALPAAAAAGKLQPFSHIEYAERRLAAYEAACVL